MSNKNEPAYPFNEEDPYGNPIQQHHGLTKRALIAAMALQGLLSNSGEEPDIEGEGNISKHYARISVVYADALLEALK